MRLRTTELVTDDEENRRRAREELRRKQRLHIAETSSWKRIDLDDLSIGRHAVANTRTGERYRVYRGEVQDAQFSPVIAWAITPDGPLFLEEPA